MEISATKMNKQRLDALTNSDTDRELGSAKPPYFWGQEHPVVAHVGVQNLPDHLLEA